MNQRLPSPTQDSTRGCTSRLGGCVGLLVVLALIAIVVWVFIVGLDALLVAPWGYPLFGRPTLAGHWVSTFTTPSGIRFALYVEIERARDAGGGAMSDEERGTDTLMNTIIANSTGGNCSGQNGVTQSNS